MKTTTHGTHAATTHRPFREQRVGDAARHLYEAEFALHIARQSGVDAWISAAYERLHPAVVEYEAALAAESTPARSRNPLNRARRSRCVSGRTPPCGA